MQLKILANLATILIAAIVAVPAYANVIISDGTFNDSDWTDTAIRLSSTGTYMESAGQSATGGNPSAFRSMTHTWGNDTQVIVFHTFLGATYDPASQGAIGHIDYAEDQIVLSNPVGGTLGRGFFVVQDGTFYRTPGNAWASTTWQTWNVADLTEIDLTDREASGIAHPDFSASGSPLTFGYWRSNTIPGPPVSIVHGIDNWQVSIVPVPEPASLALLPVAGLAAEAAARQASWAGGSGQLADALSEKTPKKPLLSQLLLPIHFAGGDRVEGPVSQRYRQASSAEPFKR